MHVLRLALCVCLLASLSLPGDATGAENARFPLRIAPGGLHLEDQAGQPFLITGDSAWSMIADLSASEAQSYVADRKARGFNTLLVSLIEHEFARNAPANIDGVAPFLEPGNFTKPNDPYFAAAERMLDIALKADMLVLLAPAYLGANGGPQGWYGEVAAAGPEALQAYGRYVGKRFARYPNVIWVQGGDYDPPEKRLVEALAAGIEAGNPGVLQTVHGDRDSATHLYWKDAGWLKLDTVYTYGDVAAAALARHRSGPRRPFFLIESRYENEHGVGASEIRKIAYGALLSGASGQVYGNNPVWHFGGPGLYDAPVGWEQALASEGAQSIGHLARFFERLDWWRLRPADPTFAVRATGLPTATAISALADDGTFAVVYLYDALSVEIDAHGLAAADLAFEWYDPSTGALSRSGPLDRNAGIHRLQAPSTQNASGSSDWLLLVRGGASRR
ncbi:DUF4038 domain-containing protein [Shinella granuli]|uniref:Collagenase-like protein with putative collagen-binding domain n=1 Tax=Shinella granuli TaxID=323621 RepID=A0A4R2CSH1_SHIGR|nr:DUF4038 domain-containing protein [Shinella granuli]TCN43745.1 collagenase-like protein with putative collagen-binding domain [Shinella granuli]